MKSTFTKLAVQFSLAAAIALFPGALLAADTSCTSDATCSAPAKCLGVVSHMAAPGSPSVCQIQCAKSADCPSGQTCQDILAVFGVCKASVTPGGAAAATSTNGVLVTLTNPLAAKTVPELIANILQTAIGIVGALALVVFIYGGIVWLTSVGSDVKIKAGKDAMKWAAIGLVIIFTSYALVNFVLKAFTG
jgi:hypothetical protein